MHKHVLFCLLLKILVGLYQIDTMFASDCDFTFIAAPKI